MRDVGFSFESVNATDYDELRPTYAPEAVRWVAERGRIGPGSLVVDLAAGTGQLSRRFVSLGVRVVAVEPAANMRPSRVEPAGRDGRRRDRGRDPAQRRGRRRRRRRERVPPFRYRCRLRRDPSRAAPGGALALFWARSWKSGNCLYPGLREIDEIVERELVSVTIVTAYRSWSEPPEPSMGSRRSNVGSFPTTHAIALGPPRRPLRNLERHRVPARRTRVALLARIGELAAGLPPTLELPERSDVQLCFRT